LKRVGIYTWVFFILSSSKTFTLE